MTVAIVIVVVFRTAGMVQVAGLKGITMKVLAARRSVSCTLI
jgi:hypothetical protein